MNILIVGASRGIGLEFVRQYRAEGHRVVATARSAEGLERIAALGAKALPLDVTGTLPISNEIPIEIIALELRSVEPINVGARLTTTVGPVSATLPITYHWQATDQSAFTTTTGLSSTTVFTWFTPGFKTITVTASNAVNSIQVTDTLEVRWPKQLYLPIILK